MWPSGGKGGIRPANGSGTFYSSRGLHLTDQTMPQYSCRWRPHLFHELPFIARLLSFDTGTKLSWSVTEEQWYKELIQACYMTGSQTCNLILASSTFYSHATVPINRAVQNRFFYFGSVSVRFFEKTRIQFRMSLVWFGSKEMRFSSDIMVFY